MIVFVTHSGFGINFKSYHVDTIENVDQGSVLTILTPQSHPDMCVHFTICVYLHIITLTSCSHYFTHCSLSKKRQPH